jgi:predicted transcriptional regulator
METKHTTIRLPKDIKAALTKQAQKERRSSSNMLVVFIQEGLERRAVKAE